MKRSSKRDAPARETPQREGRFTSKTLIVGVSGGIAAYKAAAIVSQLRQEGAGVHVVMTRAARRFVSPLTFEALSHRPVLSDLFRDQPLAHVELAHRADLILVAPATYDLIGKIAHGIADDYLTTTIAASRAPILFVPAMESQMYENPILQANMRALEALGYRFLEPECGPLASGRCGIGRFPDQEMILKAIGSILQEGRLLAGWKVLVTAGPTRESLDPMRCLTNRSSGRMGYVLASAARDFGAQVSLISGPSWLEPPAGVEPVRIESAEEMKRAVLKVASKQDVIIMAAAVADWRPIERHTRKISKAGQKTFELALEQTPDILKALGQKKKLGQLLVGFAAETDDLEIKARAKMAEKNLDLIVANEITRAGAGPEVETNIATLLYRDGQREALPLMTKGDLAQEILRRLVRIRFKSDKPQ